MATRTRRELVTTMSVVLGGLESLGRNAMRTALTALGIIIGVAAVIVMVAIGDGARQSIETQIRSAGTNLVIVMAGSANFGGVRLGQGGVQSLTEDDAFAIRREVPGIQAMSPGASTRTQVVAGNANWPTQIQGASAELPVIRSWALQYGSFFDEGDVQRASKVAVVGSVVRDQIFGPMSDPTGATIRIRNQPFKAIGVLAAKGQSAMGQDQDDAIVVPYTTVQKKLLGNTWLQNITISATTGSQIPQVVEGVQKLLRERHKIAPGANDDFMVRTPEEMATVLTSTTTTMTYLLASIAAVSLIVGGIGIMNIMLVSVTERTREIGLRLSLGARGRDVLLQFLVEAVVLSLAGGLAGVGLGLGSAALLSRVMQWTTAVSPRAVAMSFLFAAATGIFFGFYPARKASSLNPIDALRYE